MTAGCPSDEAFTRLVEGLLSESEVRDLEAHCDGCITCARLMAELARAVSPSGGGLLDERYRLLEPLGAGGMGVVYAALDTKLGRKVAIKRLRETGTGTPAEKRRGRFMREAQLLASLSHPNVLTIHDVGGADRELYVVMELIDGAPVSRWRIEKRPGWRRIVDVYLQAGRGLVAAHQLGIVHRDIKPDNILVANNGRVLVGDFGLAGLAGNFTPAGDPSPSAAPSPGSLTQTGAVLGTPAYMSPEQHDGKTGDALSDQFSFAVSLYESLHGRRPFAGRSAGEIAAATRSGSLAPGGDGVPRGIDRALAIALDPDPIRRYASMEDLLGALEQAAAADRRPAAVWLASAAVLIVAGAVGARMWMHHTPAPGAHPTPAVQASATPAPSAAKTSPASAPPPLPSIAGATDGGAHPAAPSRAAPDERSGSPHHRRQVAQAQLPGQAAPQNATPLVVTQVQILARAEQHKVRREGAACLAALSEVTGEWPAEIAERAQRARGSCEMLVGHCDEGRKLLEPIFVNQRTAETVAQGLLSREVAELCPITSFPTVQKRLSAIAIQANAANGDARSQAQWCGALERVLLKDTRSSEVQACFAEFAGFKPTAPCGYLIADIREAYRYLAECFLRDKNCREGARLDVMHTQLEVLTVATDDPRVARWCRPSRTMEMYPSCTTAAEEAQRQCMERVEAAQRSNIERLTPEILPR